MKKISQYMRDNKRIFQFILLWGAFAFILYREYFGYAVNEINATMLAFSYKFGFVSRGFIGSIYQFLDFILPFDMMNYTWTLRFMKAATLVFFIILAYFFFVAVKKSNNKIQEDLMHCALFFSIFAIPMFLTVDNFGRLDMFCMAYSLLGAILFIYEKAEWLVVVLAALGVMTHQGNVFMYLNILLVLALYKALSCEGKNRRKYIVIFILSFSIASVLFLYFEFFSRFDGENIYAEVVQMATALCNGGDFHEDVIDHEILGIDLSDREKGFMKYNYVHLPFYILLVSPYLVLGFKLFKNVISKAVNRIDKFKYFIMAIGSATLIPEFLLKCDYGRWVFAFICYYAVVILSTIAMKDELIESEIKQIFETLHKKYPCVVVLLFYPLILQPFDDIGICPLTWILAHGFNNTFLHWW